MHEVFRDFFLAAIGDDVAQLGLELRSFITRSAVVEVVSNRGALLVGQLAV